jgi:hypothetical protein
MTKRKETRLLLSLYTALYCSMSVFCLTLEFLITSVFIRGAFFVFKNISTLQLTYKIKFIVYDFMGFALITILNSIVQYYLASLLSINMRNKKHLYIIIGVSTFVASLFFIKLAAKTGFESYILASLPLTISFFLGAVMGITEDVKNNPWKGTKYQIFK